MFDLALGAAYCAVQSGAVSDPSTLTVIDYSKPSAEKRLWVFDLRSHALLYEELVAHGKSSGDNFAKAFSNIPESHQSSLGGNGLLFAYYPDQKWLASSRFLGSCSALTT